MVAKRHRREKPKKVEWRKFQGQEWGSGKTNSPPD